MKVNRLIAAATALGLCVAGFAVTGTPASAATPVASWAYDMSLGRCKATVWLANYSNNTTSHTITANGGSDCVIDTFVSTATTVNKGVYSSRPRTLQGKGTVNSITVSGAYLEVNAFFRVNDPVFGCIYRYLTADAFRGVTKNVIKPC